MTAKAHSTTRRALLGAAAALPLATLGPRSTSPQSFARGSWDKRVARYRLLLARMNADAETGDFRAANDQHRQDAARIESRFGSWQAARQSRSGRRLCRVIGARMDRAEEAYAVRHVEPTFRAAVRVALTPAPDLEAMLAKIEIMHEHELETHEFMPRHPLLVLREDVRRLAAT